MRITHNPLNWSQKHCCYKSLIPIIKPISFKIKSPKNSFQPGFFLQISYLPAVRDLYDELYNARGFIKQIRGSISQQFYQTRPLGFSPLPSEKINSPDPSTLWCSVGKASGCCLVCCNLVCAFSGGTFTFYSQVGFWLRQVNLILDFISSTNFFVCVDLVPSLQFLSIQEGKVRLNLIFQMTLRLGCSRLV